jgi:hypothetical protein
VRAQKIPVPVAGDTLLLKSAKTLVRKGAGIEVENPATTLNGNVITRSKDLYLRLRKNRDQRLGQLQIGVVIYKV